MRHALQCIGLACGAFAFAASAQTPSPAPLRLEAGTVFEVMAPELPAVQTPSWSLSQEKTFLQASRNRVFRTRFISPGNYTLQLEYGRLPNVESHTLRIQVEPASGTAQSGDVAAGRSISATKPARDTYGRVVLAGGTGIVGLYPYQSLSGSMLTLDTDDAQDADGDGNAQNDDVVTGTYFSLRGTPMFLWYFAPAGKRVVNVQNGSGMQTVIPIVDESTALQEEATGELTPVTGEQLPPLEGRPTLPPPSGQTPDDVQPVLQGNGEVMAETLTGTLLRFSLVSADLSDQAVLLHWTFGDGTESLLSEPVHRYAQAGTYTVEVTVTDLRTARIIGAETVIVEVDEPSTDVTPPQTGSSSSTSSAPQASQARGWLTSVFSMLGVIWKYFFWFVLSALLAVLVRLFFGATKRMGSIPELVAKVEKTFTEPAESKENNIADIIASPAAPLTLNVVETTAAEQLTEMRESEPAPAAASDSATPDWLKDGLEMAAATGQTLESPPPPALNISVQETAPAETVTPVLPPEPWSAPTAQLDPAPAVETIPAIPMPEVANTQAEAPTPDWLTAPLPTLDDAPPVQENAEAALTPTEPVAPPPPAADETPAIPVENETNDQTFEAQAPSVTDVLPTSLPSSDPIQEENAAPAKAWADMSQEEREREKKRQKRKRYRQNKKLREKNTAATPATAATTTETTPEKTKESESEKHDDEDGPTFVIRADSIS